MPGNILNPSQKANTKVWNTAGLGSVNWSSGWCSLSQARRPNFPYGIIEVKVINNERLVIHAADIGAISEV